MRTVPLRRRSRLAMVAVVALSAAALAACSSSSSKSPSASASAPGSSSSVRGPAGSTDLVAASKKESGLIIYGNPPAQLWAPVVKAFNATYPWIKVTPYDVDDNTVFSKYAAEHGTHARTADIIVASAPNLWLNASKNHTVIDYTPTDVMAHYPSFAKQFPGVFVLSADPAITIYNTALVSKSQVPDTFAALSSAVSSGKYQGKLSTYTIDNTFGYASSWGLVQKKGWSILDTLGPQTKPAADGGAMLQTVAQGGASIGYLESGLVRGALGQFKGVVDWEYMKDFTPLIPRAMGITAGASSPNSAKLFENFLYSTAGQQAMCSGGFNAYRTDFTPTGCQATLQAVYQAVGGQQNTFLVPINQKITDDQKSFTARWHTAFHN
ncbi:ABC transporter substrate-binding protein [Jatrophihabitans lederbergiae]|uniref:Extracellular solute-binding protein n=1 Tax=Jatrophihabitans lederbergiae TaxID=3075547 RepID=A0ABU2JFF8_9ACTN|nr:extracellular solute-binding protein [Jatrophihabitans sp. DSM 44399]MDT0263732.1 extracellular solute-binding protein [Jatrophihabitans sp. DSM 44399]